MFSAVRIGRGEIDVGAIAEALVYYGRVNLFVNGGSLADFVAKFGYDAIVQALDIGVLDLTFERHMYAVHTNTYGNLEAHGFANVALAGTAQGAKIETAADEIEHQFTKRFGNTANNKQRARSLTERVHVSTADEQVLQMARLDVKDLEFVGAAVGAFLKAVVPEYQLPVPLRAEVVTTKDGFVFLSNLDFAKINEFYHRRIPASHSSVTKAYILSHILDARKELQLASSVDSDLWVNDGISAVLQQRVTTISKRLTKSQKDIEYFHTVEFESRSYREVLNKGERTGADLVAFLQQEETMKFKTWLAGQNPDGFLIKEYDKAVLSRQGWTQRLPFRISKLVTFTGLGMAVDATVGTMGLATLAAHALSGTGELAVGATDEFVVPKLLKGWKPNQFVEGPAQEFLGTKD